MKKITQNLMVALTIFSSMAIISQTEVEDTTLQELEEVVLMGSGVIDLAADRVTPVAASTIKGSEIQKKIVNLSLRNNCHRTKHSQSNH